MTNANVIQIDNTVKVGDFVVLGLSRKKAVIVEDLGYRETSIAKGPHYRVRFESGDERDVARIAFHKMNTDK